MIYHFNVNKKRLNEWKDVLQYHQWNGRYGKFWRWRLIEQTSWFSDDEERFIHRLTYITDFIIPRTVHRQYKMVKVSRHSDPVKVFEEGMADNDFAVELLYNSRGEGRL